MPQRRLSARQGEETVEWVTDEVEVYRSRNREPQPFGITTY
jgi:hypothetical protein